MSVLSSFLRVPRVSTLVSSAAAAAKLLPAADCPCGSPASRRRARRLRPTALATAPPCPAAGGLQEERREGPAMEMVEGDERERDDTWDSRGSLGELNKWIARLLEGTIK